MARKGKIEIKEFLPEFNLPNYDICNKWTTKDWYQALSVRYEYFHDTSKTEPYWSERKVNLTDRILDLMKDPAASFVPDDEIFQQDWSAVSDMPIEDFFLGHYLANNSEEYAKHYSRIFLMRQRVGGSNYKNDKEASQLISELSEPAWKFHKKTNNFNGELPTEKLAQFYISVDLMATDRTLINQFEAWLGKIRKESKIPNMQSDITDSKMKNWHLNRLLPYLDLSIWTRLQSKKFSVAEYVDILESTKGNSEFSRDVIEKAKQLMTPNIIFALQSETFEYFLKPPTSTLNFA